MKAGKLLMAVIVLCFVYALSGCTQTGQDLKPMKDDIAKLKEDQAKITKELQDVKKLLEARAPKKPEEFKEALIDVSNDPFEGDKLAKVALIEFNDFQ